MSLRDVITAIFRTATVPVTPVNPVDTTSTTTSESSAVHLYKVAQSDWRLTRDGHPAYFSNVDSACDYLLANLNVLDEQIDLALIDMVAKGTTHAVFAAGHFVFSDQTRFDS